MDKVKQSTKNVTPFGGLNFIYDAISRYGISVWLDQQIGYRSALAQYSYSDIVLSLFGNTLVQGSFVADLQILKARYADQVFHMIPSPDTARVCLSGIKTGYYCQNSAFRRGA